MKRGLLSVATAMLSIGAMAQIGVGTLNTKPQNVVIGSQTPEWQDVSVYKVGKEAPRAYFMSYLNRAEAVANDFTKSEFYLPLNGRWKFFYTDDHRNRPKDFYKPEFSVSSWKEINVPTNWERQGYGTAIYTNQPYEFAPKNPKPPTLPEAVPVGLYRRTFNIEFGWLDRDVFLHIGGVKSGAYVYINGQKVGYSEDSKSAAEFLINPYIKDGQNTLAIEVYRWSTGSYLECQDFWRVSGIERDVYIYSQPKMHLEDFYVNSSLDSSYTNGLFGLEMCLTNNFIRPTGEMQIWFELENEAGELVEYSYAEIEMQGMEKDTVRFAKTIKNVHKWSAEDPYLYTLVLKIKQNNKFTEYISQKVGFRTSEIKGNQYLVNGKRVFIKGVNYHETHEVTGHYVDEATIIKDMELMKQANVNAIRLCHYPQQRRFYELSDKYGFYVCDEANIESHGIGYDLRRTLGNNPAWLGAHMERTQNMYHQNKNYPCVMFWSLGNEAGNGYNFYQTYLWLKSKDLSRPVQYERALLEWNTDIYCPQYPSAALFEAWGKGTTDRPYIASEYAHAMGNSTGTLHHQWQMIYKYPNLQGGFIWDWVDQGFLEYNKDSTQSWWSYGGDYGAGAPSDGNFLCNGIISPDRTPHPAHTEVKYVYQYIQFKAMDLSRGQVEIKNIYDFNSLSKYDITWAITGNGTKVAGGTLALNLAPNESKTVTIPISSIKTANGVEYFLNFTAKLKASDGLLKKGAEVAADQFMLPIKGEKPQYTAKGSVKVEQAGNDIELSSNSFSMVIDKPTGQISSYSVNGVQMMDQEFGLRPNFWRAPTDNDYGSAMPMAAKLWRDISLGDKAMRASSVTLDRNAPSGTAMVVAKYMLPESTSLTITYKVYASGMVNVGYDFKGNSNSSALIPRLGMRMRLPKEYSTLEYLGRGAVENYSDRSHGTFIGRYKSDAKIEGFDYVRPQETGHHTDTRWIALTKAKGAGLLFQADGTMEFNALNASVEDYDGESSSKDYQWRNFSKEDKNDPKDGYLRLPKQTHLNDVPARDYVELNIDGRMMGLGGDDSWGSRPEKEHTISAADDFTFGFTIIPIRTSTEISKVSGTKY
ncbi:MAG: glycoside hydrolase family 2 TIM barrel-domain containing protein [Mucinivorans sp.]